MLWPLRTDWGWIQSFILTRKCEMDFVFGISSGNLVNAEVVIFIYIFFTMFSLTAPNWEKNLIGQKFYLKFKLWHLPKLTFPSTKDWTKDFNFKIILALKLKRNFDHW